MADLQSAFVNAYEPHVRGRIADLGISVTGPLSEAIEHGRVWLESALGECQGWAFDQQRRGPLELFQEAMRFPQACLSSQVRSQSIETRSWQMRFRAINSVWLPRPHMTSARWPGVPI